jgi:lysophospholipase L1-like esterase
LEDFNQSNAHDVVKGNRASAKQRRGRRRRNVNDAVADAGGGLSAELTDDGLHLNPKGYK